MTSRTNARAAGVAFLVYIGAGVSGMAGAHGPVLRTELSFVEVLCALTLAVTLYALTREVDEDIARLAMTCRVAEGIVGAAALAGKFNALAVGATLFAAGSTLFCWLLVRGRLIPGALAWLGVLASVLLVVALPLQLAGAFPNVFYIWLPMLVFELAFAILLIAKGVRTR